jgi:hypothetical protein
MLARKCLTDAEIQQMMTATLTSEITERLQCEKPVRLFWIMCQIEPGLQQLLDEIRCYQPDPERVHCAPVTFGDGGNGHKPFKQRMARLVGWWAGSRRNTYLASSIAYMVAYRALLNALPPYDDVCYCV